MREIIAILRGVTPKEVQSIGEVLIAAGITKIEVPLNSPEAFSSVELLVRKLGNFALVGAGTVLDVSSVLRLADIGARMVVSPNCNPDVIQASKTCGLVSYPGVFSPTECFTALRAGADGLKFFPASQIGISGLKAYFAVLPKNLVTFAVGGVHGSNFRDWMEAGISGFGIGTTLYVPGQSATEILQKAATLCAAYDEAKQTLC